MDIFHQIADIFTDKGSSARRKIFYILILLAIFLSVDYGTGFFTNTINGQRLEQLEKIETMLAMPSVDSTTKQYLRDKRLAIISNRSYFEWSSDFLSFMQKAIKSATTTTKQDKKKQKKKDSIRIEPWVIYHTLTSGWLIILLMIGTPFYAFGRKENRIFSVAVLLIQELLLFGLVLGLAYALSAIPIIGAGFTNLVINFMIGGATSFILVDLFGSRTIGRIPSMGSSKNVAGDIAAKESQNQRK